MRLIFALILLALGACAAPRVTDLAVAPAARVATLAVYHGEVRDGVLTLTREQADDRVVQPLSAVTTLPITSSGPTGTTTPTANTVLLHQTVARSLDGACNSAPYGDPGVPSSFQGVCVSIQAINGYAASEVVRTHAEITSLTAGVTTYVKAASDATLAVDNTLGLWYYDRLAATGTSGNLDRRTVNWFFETPVPGGSASFSFTVVVKGQLVDRVARVVPVVGATGCHVTADGADISADGRYVAFVTSQNGCFGVGGATQVMRLDRQTGALVVVSHGAGTSNGSNGSVNDAPSISDNGEYVAWRSNSTNLLPSGVDALGATDGNGATASVFVRHVPSDDIAVADIDMGTLSTVAGQPAARPSISADGTFVVFETAAALDASDGNALTDVYLRDIWGGSLVLASLDNPGRTAAATRGAVDAAGAHVVFESADDTLVSGDSGHSDVFVFDVAAGTVARVSTDASGGQANAASSHGAISDDGAVVAFQSVATNLLGAATTAGRSHVYARPVASAAGLVRGDGRALTSGAEANGNATQPRLDYDGRLMTFVSTASNLDPFVTSNGIQMYVVDVGSATPLRAYARMVSATPTNAPSGGGVPSDQAWVASGGNYAMFRTEFSGNLVGDSAVGPYLYVAPLR